MVEPIAEPIWMIGPSRPADPPEPIIGSQLLAELGLPRRFRNLRRWLGRVAGLVGVAVLLAWFLGAIDLVSGWVVAGASLALVLGWAAGERPWRLERH